MAEEYISGEQHQALKTAPHGTTVTVPARTIGLVVIVAIALALSFWGGTIYGKNHAPKPASTVSTSNSGFGGRFGGMRGGFGQVTAVSSSSLTIQNQRTGNSNTYTITSSTTITDNGQTVTASDIQVGDTVIVRPSSSSSTTAASIDVNPSFGGGPVSGSAAPSNSQTN